MDNNKTKYITNNGNTTIISVDSATEQLPVGTYVTILTDRGFSLNSREPFVLPSEIFGPTDFPQRVLSTYQKMGKGMGVLLSGPKGTGKTVEAKTICVQSNMPVVLITSGFTGVQFGEFIESIKTPSIMFIDEFEKVYDDENIRNFFLSIMDGVAKSRHLFLVTSNSADVGQFFTSRPGRVRYHKEYQFLGDEILREIIDKKLANKANCDAVFKALLPFPNLSMDSLVCIIDECNMYDELPKDFMHFFNVKSEIPTNYSVELHTVDHVKKEGILPAENSKLENAIYEIEEYGETKDQALVKKLTTVEKIVYKSSYCSPFEYGENGHINIRNLFADDPKKPSKSVNWNPEQITSFTMDRKGFKAVHKNGDVLIATPVTLSRNWNAF